MMRATTLLLLTVAFSSTAIFVQGEDWPQWRGPNRDGLSTERGLLASWKATPPKHLWTVDGMGAGYAGVSISKGRAYTTGNLEKGQGVICVDLKTQQVLWSTLLTPEPPQHGYPGARCTPTIDGNDLYAVTSNGSIACLDAANGSVRWQKEFKEWGGKMMSGWGFSESPLVDGDHVLCTPGGGALMVCLNKKNGEEIWKSTSEEALGEKGKDGAGYSSIVISQACGVKQYVTLIGRGVIGVSAADGKLLWHYNKVANGVANIPTPICVGDQVFCSSGYNDGGTALLTLSKSGDAFAVKEEYWLDNTQLQNHHGGMVLVGDYIYFGAKHNNGFPVCVDYRNAAAPVKWGNDQRGPGSGSAAVVYADGNLIFRYQDGTLALVGATPDGYELKGSFAPVFQEKESWAHPTVSDGKLYLREQNKLMCYDLKAS